MNYETEPENDGKPPIPENEAARLEALYSYDILDTPGEQEYDDIALIAAQICGTPIAALTLIDETRQWFKAKVGIDSTEGPREESFCAHALTSESEIMIVSDATKDVRFANNPLVTNDPSIRFYAGAPLVTPDNLAVGTLCVIDRKPRKLSEHQYAALQALARQVASRLELRRVTNLLNKANADLRNLTLTDDLTGLCNHRGFFFQVERQLKIHRSRPTAKNLWLMMADMDRLKPINDEYGHQEGSFAIKKTGEILRRTLRESDIIARFGGDEFAALLINTVENADQIVATRLQENLDAYNLSGEKPYRLALSCGFAPIISGDDTPLEKIVKQADDAMYEQKRAKRANRTD